MGLTRITKNGYLRPAVTQGTLTEFSYVLTGALIRHAL